MRAVSRLLLNIYDFLVIYLSAAWLGIMCLVWTPFAIILTLLLPESRGRALGRYAIMVIFRVFLGMVSLSRRFSFDLEALDALRDQPPLIIAPNHPSLVDAVLVISRLPNVACVLKAELMNNIFLGAGARLARYIRNEPVRRMIRSAIRDFDCGSHLLLFPEGTRTTSAPINPLKGSISLIALHAQRPVQTVLIETDSRYLGKGWSLFRIPPMPIHYRVRLGRRFDPPQNARDYMVELEHYFAQELAHGSAFYPAGPLPAQADHTSQLIPPAPS
jgi:1-acyl-sn-glycerol-3-phosphate acyltransferase